MVWWWLVIVVGAFQSSTPKGAQVCCWAKRGRGRASKRVMEAQGEQLYSSHLRGLLREERETEEAAAKERIERWSRRRLAELGLALLELEARKKGAFFGRPVARLRRSDGEALPFHRFGTGDLVALSRKAVVVEGAVLERGAAHLDVVLAQAVEPSRGYRLDQYYSATSYERMDSAIDAVVDEVALELRRVVVQSFVGGPAWLDLANEPAAGLCRRAPSEAAARRAVARATDALDGAQREAAARALRRRVSLIVGPPGTGKTRVAAAVVAAAVRLRDAETSKRERALPSANRLKKRVLACAASNVATDNLLERLLELGVDAVRVGHPASTRPALRNATLDARARRLGVSRRRILGDADVVVASCVGAGHAVLDEHDEPLCFGLVVVDEASQATEPACLVPVATASGASQLVLVGDHNQLPPTVVSRAAHRGGLGTSLFARLVAGGLGTSLLSRQYRMHPTLNAYSSTRFYASRVLTDPLVERQRRSVPPPRGFDWPTPHEPLAFVPIIASPERQGSGDSYVNDGEVAAVVRTVVNLAAAGDVGPDDIGIVTPYAAQARAIADALLFANLITLPEVATVDAYQGREKDVIIISTVRSNRDQTLGFLADFRRLNVALTRARHALICFGDAHTLRADRHWAAFVTFCDDLDCRCPPLDDDDDDDGAVLGR
ncbi:hypothetical protein CTAYLR_008004 [Chrysophaeum taylorii]|uniref:AAA+ ATPase domain-containing protein n=1 Tax=Chrysophaeum taylorii TaxID=2483200 RepID=A0AAD7U7V2_9STRA|nr:hypothetical protein CTAYLR_008004 [Chrysophaeum taylorii]